MNLLLDFSNTFPMLWLTGAGILGCIIGSFLNMVIYRLPLMLERGWQQEALLQLAQPIPESTKTFNLMYPRSFCPHCSCPLRVRDNIPLLSYLYLKGRAHCCGKRISYYYLLVELACAILFMLAAWAFSPGVLLIGAWIFLSMLLVLAVIDYRTYLLPDILTLPLVWLGLLFNLQNGYVPLDQAVIGAISGYLCLWSLYWIYRLSTGNEAIGYGDFKLLSALGAWMGWMALPQILLQAAGSGFIVTLLQRGHAQLMLNRPLAFGPWLALGGACHFLMILGF
ncbi:prepilin peptidase [Escherichia coli]|nr:prepilin peptidase [Escherichia coli]EJY1967276.1 prepilin peptidase [Escherichia coli]